MAYYHCNGSGSAGVNVQKMVQLTESEFNALVTKSDDTIYFVMNENKNLHLFTYQGDRRILNYIDESELSDYEFWYEDVYFMSNIDSTGTAKIDVPLAIFAEENAGRDFEIRLSCVPISGVDNYLISDISANYSLKINHNSYPNKIISSGVLNEAGTNTKWLSYNYGSEFIYKRVNNNVEIWSGVTMIDTWPARSYNNNQTCTIGSFSYYYFYGNIKYIGFKWLS